MMKATDRSLAEQMGLDELEIARRKALLDFGQSQAETLLWAKALILRALDGIVEEFYERQTSIYEVSMIIGDSETLSRLRAAQRNYIAELFSGSYDQEYVNGRLRIGLVHKRIGVEPKYYLSAVKSLRDILARTLRETIQDTEIFTETLVALDRLLYFDTDLVVSTYLRSMLLEIEANRNRVVEYARTLEAKVAERTKELEKLSQVDFLTGLLNKRAFVDEFRRELLRANRSAQSVAVVYFDVDRFKRINDGEGHARGDEILKQIGSAVDDVKREVDVAGRCGGDEFCVVLPGSELHGARQFIDRLTGKLKSHEPGIGLSFGIVRSEPGGRETTDELMHRADQDMYRAKARKQRQEKRRDAEVAGKEAAPPEPAAEPPSELPRESPADPQPATAVQA